MARPIKRPTVTTLFRRDRIKIQIDYLVGKGVKKKIIREIAGCTNATLVTRWKLNNWTIQELTLLENGLPKIFEDFPHYGGRPPLYKKSA